MLSFNIKEPGITEISSRAYRTWKIVSTKDTYILKQYNNTDLNSLQTSIELQDRLRTHGMPIPAFKKNSSRSPITPYKEKLYVLMSFVDHDHLSVPSVEMPALKQAAVTLGLLHKLDQGIYQDLLKRIDFQKTTEAVSKLITEFQKKYTSLYNRYPKESDLLHRLHLIIKATDSLRQSNDAEHFISNWACIHGDYTPDNILIERSSNNLFVIDWDNAKIAPRAFEIHKAIGAFCGLAPYNAYLVPIDWEKAEVFLRAYHATNPLTEEIINEIIVSAAYCSSTYWLRFTLLQTLAEDFRMLDLLPETIKDCLFWKNNLDRYRDILMSQIRFNPTG